MLVVAVVMILVVGPKDLPGMLRTIGKTVGNLRRMAGDFQRQFSDALKEADIDEVQKDISKATSFSNPLEDINKSADELMNSLELEDLTKSTSADLNAINDEALTADGVGVKPATKPTKTRKASKGDVILAKKIAAGKAATKKPAAAKPPAKKTAAKAPAAKAATPSITKSTAAKSTATKTTNSRKAKIGGKSA